jgi:hypothetical protein
MTARPDRGVSWWRNPTSTPALAVSFNPNAGTVSVSWLKP